ncbi:hypothetical protein EST38_g9147 [Candolleomyces aberdarensis]|uniref:RNA-directed DNA polymerase n=1 Tax=Candolleomyces aberdarensis TaxID=2316362 RepID=A0A4Q2DD00_9AGAR|nr:hypothetical protein EST38_g9147 [Candolleomyces aberdarensis]
MDDQLQQLITPVVSSLKEHQDKHGIESLGLETMKRIFNDYPVLHISTRRDEGADRAIDLSSRRRYRAVDVEAQEIIRDRDVLSDLSFDLKTVAGLLVGPRGDFDHSTGSGASPGGDRVKAQEFTFLDVSVLLYIDLERPYIKVSRLFLVVSTEFKRKGQPPAVWTVTGTYKSSIYVPGSDFLETHCSKAQALGQQESRNRSLLSEVYLVTHSPLNSSDFDSTTPFVPVPRPPSSNSSIQSPKVSEAGEEIFSTPLPRTPEHSPGIAAPITPRVRRIRTASFHGETPHLPFSTPVNRPFIPRTPFRATAPDPSLLDSLNLAPVISWSPNRYRKPKSDTSNEIGDDNENEKSKKMPGEEETRGTRSPSPALYKPLPGRFERRAPRWDLAPSALEEFLDEYEELCHDCGLPSDLWVESVVRYAPDTDTRLMWKALARGATEWKEYRKKIIQNTPGAGEDHRHAPADLDDLISSYRSKKIRTRAQFNEYWKKFFVISDYLVTKKRLSVEEQSKKLLEGLPDALARRVRSQLRIQYPTHHPSDPYDVDQIFQAVNFVLTALDADMDDDFDDMAYRRARTSNDANTSAPNSSAVTNRQVYDATELTKPTNQLDGLVKTFSNMMETFTNVMANNSPGGSRRPVPRGPPRSGGPRAYQGCHFCSGDGHFTRECPKFNDYVSRGLCQRDQFGRVCFLDGTMISVQNSVGKDYAERVDNWNRARQPQGPTVVSSNLLDIVYDVPSSPTVPTACAFIEEVTIDDPTPTQPADDIDIDDLPMYEAMVQEGQRKIAAARHKMQLRSNAQQKATTNDDKAKASAAAPSNTPKTTTVTNGSSDTSTSSTLPQKLPVSAPAPAPQVFAPVLTPDSFPQSQNLNPSQYHYVTPIADPKVIDTVAERSLDSSVTLTTRELLAVAPDVRKVVKDKVTTRRVAATGILDAASVNQVSTLPTAGAPHLASFPLNTNGKAMTREAETLRTIETLLDGRVKVNAILDDGSQIIGIRRDIWEKLALPLCSDCVMTMESANRSRNDSLGLLSNLPLRIGHLDFYVQAQVMDSTSYEVLLGRPFHVFAQAVLRHFSTGDAHVTLTEPNSGQVITVPTRPRLREVGVGIVEIALEPTSDGSVPVAEFESYKYKKVANRTKPVTTTLPSQFRIVRKRPEGVDPLDGMPTLPTHPGQFTPGTRYTLERMTAMNINPHGFLWTEEEKLVHELIRAFEHVFAWDESEKGMFLEDYFDPVLIAVTEHIPWILPSIPIPQGLRDRIIAIIKDKIASGVIEPSNAAYRSRWFWVLKKDGKSLRIVHDLQPLNAVSIKDSAVPPVVEPYAESFAGRACYSVFDLFVGFDQRVLHPDSRDLTTFQTPLGTFRLTRIPMGYTNSQQIQHGDITFLLQDEIPHITQPFVDDVPIRGPKTRYELPDGGYETISDNPGIRRFIWEHLTDCARILQRIGHAGGTFSGPKAQIAVPEAVIVGHLCCYEGRKPLPDRVQKVLDWPIPKDVTGIRGFMGVVGTLRMFIKDLAIHAEPLIRLVRRKIPFEFGVEQLMAMEKLKYLVKTCTAIRPIDYESQNEVILAVDSSVLAVGYILSQMGDDGLRYPSRYGSITWNETERRYSQAKIELFGLLRALKDVRIYIIGVSNLVVEVDARYIKGMINNPDIQPNATINRWIAGILLFHFKLRHVPARLHTAADGLSRREPSPLDPIADDDYDEWIDRANAFAVEILNQNRLSVSRRLTIRSTSPTTPPISPYTLVLSVSDATTSIPRSDKASKLDSRIQDVQHYLETLERPDNMSDKDFQGFIRYTFQFFFLGGKLWGKSPTGAHQLYIPPPKRLSLIQQAHDDLGHKGIFTVRSRLLARFWWPQLLDDVKWFVSTCHECQVRSSQRLHIPPTVPAPFNLFRKVYIDTMLMPRSYGYRYIVHARCSLSSYPEWRMLRSESAPAIAAFIFEEILCRWGAVEEIVTDNGTPYVAEAVELLVKRYGIHRIRISPYNSQANGVVERRHLDVREALVKAAGGDESKWPLVAPSVFWAERVTVRKATGYSPYYLAHGIEPLLPFNLAEGTFMAPPPQSVVSTEDLIAYRARMLQKRPEDLERARMTLHKARIAYAREFEDRFKSTIQNFDFQPGTLVLVRNSRLDSSIGYKTKPRYLGPMAVLRRTSGGSYVLAELDGSVSKLRFAAYRLVPYLARNIRRVPVTDLTDLSGEQLNSITHDREDPASPLDL